MKHFVSYVVTTPHHAGSNSHVFENIEHDFCREITKEKVEALKVKLNEVHGVQDRVTILAWSPLNRFVVGKKILVDVVLVNPFHGMVPTPLFLTPTEDLGDGTYRGVLEDGCICIYKDGCWYPRPPKVNS